MATPGVPPLTTKTWRVPFLISKLPQDQGLAPPPLSQGWLPIPPQGFSKSMAFTHTIDNRGYSMANHEYGLWSRPSELMAQYLLVPVGPLYLRFLIDCEDDSTYLLGSLGGLTRCYM